LFSDSINLKLLKKQTDALGKEIFVLTMDEKGQAYAQEAGFQLKFLPKMNANKAISDIRVAKKSSPEEQAEAAKVEGVLASTVKEVQEVVKRFVPASVLKSENMEADQEPVTPILSDTYYPQESQAVLKKPAKKSHINKFIIATVTVSLIVILLLVFVILPKATVIVYARSEPLTRDFLEISLSPNVKAIDYAKLSLPAEKIETDVFALDDFQSQGKKQVGNRAAGTIKIYNFTKVPINLKASTTSFVLGGKIYNLLSDVSGLKPTTYKNAQTKEVNEGSLGEPFQIIAAQGGEDYNLPAGTRLEITNEVFGSQPQLLYAKTESELTGGTTRYLSVISAEDEAEAKEALLELSLKEFRSKLAAEGKVLADKAFATDSLDFKLSNPVGTETPSFDASIKAKVSGLVFKGEDLKKLIFGRIEETLASNKTLRAKNPDKTVYRIKSLDLNNQVAVMEAHFEGEAVYNLNLPYIAPELVGKTQNEVYEILRSKAEIDKVDIILAPSWQKNFPYFAKQIEVKVATENLVGN